VASTLFTSLIKEASLITSLRSSSFAAIPNTNITWLTVFIL
jgi:hypothetical protein